MSYIATEEEEQITFVEWLNTKQELKGLFHHPPNGGWRSKFEAARFKRLGVSPGVPDICIYYPVNSYHGLFIEMKRKEKYNTSIYQKEWIERLNNMGYKAKIAFGCDEAIEIVEEYLRGGIIGNRISFVSSPD